MIDARSALPAALRGFRRRCRRCGAESSDLGDPRVGFSCCLEAATDQKSWRQAELDRLREQARLEQARVEELEAEARSASGYKVDEATAKADRARRGLAARLRDHYGPIADELNREIARADAAIRALEQASS